MAEYFVKMAGNDGADGLTELTAWRTVPGISGANAVVSGDIINIEDGYEIHGLQLILPANNLTYRVFGKSTGKFLSLKLPVFVTKVPQLFKQKIVREPGVHEGYWTLNAGGITSQGALNYGTRTGCVVEDLQILDSVNNSAAISIGSSAQAQIGATLRRCQVVNAKQAVSNYRPNTLIEYCLFENTSDDGVIVATGATQSFHAGNFNTVQYNNFINIAYDATAAIGDPFQLLASTGYQGTLTVANNYTYKPSGVKQGFMLADIAYRVYIYNNYFDGVDTGSTQIGLTDVLTGAKVYIQNNYWTQAKTNGNPAIRIVGGVTEINSEIYIQGNFVDIPENAGLFSWGSDNAAPAGAVFIRNNRVRGIAHNGLSWSATIGLQTAGTIGASASATVENNLLEGASPVAFRLPTGGLNDSRWVFRNNLADGAFNFAAVGTYAQTVYTKITFEAGHSTATGNKEEAATQAALEAAGYFYGYVKDMNGKAFYNPPSIGCYEYERPRNTRA